MNSEQRHALTKALAAHVVAIAADIRAQMLTEGVVRDRAKVLHHDEQVGEDFDVWTDLLSRRVAVLWVLKTVYVRVLEDRGLLRPGRLIDPEAQQLFERLAPNLGETAFLSWVFRDLGSSHGGLPELFARQPAEIAVPTDSRSRALLEFWRAKDADTGFQWTFAHEAFAGELMGDLYQELDPVVGDRFALCQTPEFVRDFMLGETLMPAIVELGADKVRLLDPACGSGHFLLDALRRLVAATAAQHVDWSRREVVDHALERVVGIDLNDYACALARARMVMTAAELAGLTSLADSASFHPHIYWADGLEQIERDEGREAVQLDLLGPNTEPPPRAVLTRPHVRALLRPILKQRFQVIVGNPPYIAERDPARKDYHRESVGRHRRYVSAYREYSLAAPFIERCLQLSDESGRVGLIVGNNFMKREFGKPLIEDVIAGVDLELVVDSSQLQIGDHGTPTVILIARNRQPHADTVRAVMGKRADAAARNDPGRSNVWRSVLEGRGHAGFANEFVSVSDISRQVFSRHPWSLGGGGAAELKETLDSRATQRLSDVVDEIGAMSVIRADDVYEAPHGAATGGLPREWLLPHGVGEDVRDWSMAPSSVVIHPYDQSGSPLDELPPPLLRRLLPFRTLLEKRVAFGNTQIERGLKWFEYSMLFKERFGSALLLVFPNVATHNHFALLRERIVVNSKAPIIKLVPGSTEDDYLGLLALLNSSIGGFWMKQVFHCRGGQGVNEGTKAELWEQFYDFDVTKLKLFPIPPGHGRVVPWAREFDRIARRRAERSIASVLSGSGWKQAKDLRLLLEQRRREDLADFGLMVALQEELDWECYRLYGLVDDGAKTRKPEELEAQRPNWRPFELNLAMRDGETHAAIARAEETTEIPTMWFRRHGWEPLTELPTEAPTGIRSLVTARRAQIEASPTLSLVEQTTYKRRWYRPDYERDEQAALALWLADRIEKTASERSGKPCTLAQLTAVLESDPRVHAIAELLTGRQDYRLAELLGEAIATNTVPEHPFHLYKGGGFGKYAAWERIRADERKDGARQPANLEIPAKYTQGDFLKPEYFRLRGKLDVPKERFIAFTETPGRGAGETLYGWAGWTAIERIKALLALDEECEDQGIPVADRIALLDSAWRLVSDAIRDDAATGARLRAELAAIVGPDGPSKVLLDAWREKHPPPAKTRGRNKKPQVKTDVDDDEDDA